MSDKKQKKQKTQRLKARQPRGFPDRDAADIRATQAMMEKIKGVYELYGFDPVETPFFEYTDALGKFLPDTDRPNEGVFSLTDDDEQWMSLRYDLTAPLARHFAQNISKLQTPYRTYRAGWVFRNEKPGPGRFRQFMQFDADTVGAPNPSADAEMCMMMADTMEALGLKEQYSIRVNDRRILDGVMDSVGLGGDTNAGRRLGVLRAIDKVDRLGTVEVSKLLGVGRRDESGDWKEGVSLTQKQVMDIGYLMSIQHAVNSGEEPKEFIYIDRDIADSEAKSAIDYSIRRESAAEDVGTYAANVPDDYFSSGTAMFGAIAGLLEAKVNPGQNRFTPGRENPNVTNLAAIDALNDIIGMLRFCDRVGERYEHAIRFDFTCVRGLEYYTGAVYECELTFPVKNEKGETVQFGSVAGGGRYDGLVKRFTGQDIPATGFSIGVSRLMTALKNLGKLDDNTVRGPVMVTVMDRDTEALAAYQQMVQQLRSAGIRAEMYQGNPKHFGKQLQYADRRGSPIAIIQGSDEREQGVVQIKDLALGAKLAEEITDNEEWRASRPAQREVAVDDLAAEVRKTLDAQRDG